MEQSNAESPSLLTAWAWVEQKKKPLAYAAVAVALVALVAAYLSWSARESRAAAGQALSKALFSRDASGNNAATLLKVASAHANTPAAEQALLLAADEQYKAGKFAEAQSTFEKLRAQHPESQFVPQALLGAGTALMAQGKADEAVRTFKECVDRYPLAPVAAHAKFNLANAYEQVGKGDLAYPLYEQVIRDTFAPSIRNEALQRYTELQPKFAPAPAVSEAASTNTPPTQP